MTCRSVLEKPFWNSHLEKHRGASNVTQSVQRLRQCMGVNGPRPVFDGERQRPDRLVHPENYIPQPLDLTIELIHLQLVTVISVKQPPRRFDQALRASDDIESASYNEVEHPVSPAA
ncbi:hypothetical protein RPHASCH2410_PD02475 (plasmid) [Rhizobium phaseoli Ch24-10]|nr:hypothetical protein RPHASCH2410_PD02475 [Rhizobium phaseoli Ch24-10]